MPQTVLNKTPEQIYLYLNMSQSLTLSPLSAMTKLKGMRFWYLAKKVPFKNAKLIKADKKALEYV